MAYEYDCNIIYNNARSPLSKTPDTNLSLQFIKRLVGECERQNLRCYYHDRDALPGRLLFQEIAKVVKSSRFTILILTKGFVQDCYSTYRQSTALKMLIDDKRFDQLIPVAIGLETVPDELCAFIPEHFCHDPASWDTDESRQSWGKLLQRLTGQDVRGINGRNVNSQAVQESGDNQQRTEINNAFVAEPTLSLDGSASEVSDGSRIMEEPPATIQYSEEVESNQQVSDSMSLVQSPTIQPPDLITPSRSAGLSASNRNAAPPVAPNDSSSVQRDSAGRQISLSQDGDLSMDLGSSQSHLRTPDFTDSGYSPDNNVETASTSTDAAGSLEDISENMFFNLNDHSIPNEESCTQGTGGNNIMKVNNSNGADTDVTDVTDVTNITKSKTTVTESLNESLSSQANQETPHQTQHQEGASFTTVTEQLNESLSSQANQKILHQTQHQEGASFTTVTESLNESLSSQTYQKTPHQTQHQDGASFTTVTEKFNESLSSQANQETPHQTQHLKEASYTTVTESDSYIHGEAEKEMTEVYEQVTVKIEASSPPMTEVDNPSNSKINRQGGSESSRDTSIRKFFENIIVVNDDYGKRVIRNDLLQLSRRGRKRSRDMTKTPSSKADVVTKKCMHELNIKEATSNLHEQVDAM